MTISKIEVVQITCEMCGYQWIPRIENPKVCPRCKNFLDAKHRKKDIEKLDQLNKKEDNNT